MPKNRAGLEKARPSPGFSVSCRCCRVTLESEAAQGFREYQLKVLSATQANIDAIFEYAQEAVRAQSVSELVELSTTHSRRQLEMIAEQAREIAALLRKSPPRQPGRERESASPCPTLPSRRSRASASWRI
jgi:Phasin protein